MWACSAWSDKLRNLSHSPPTGRPFVVSPSMTAPSQVEPAQEISPGPHCHHPGQSVLLHPTCHPPACVTTVLKPSSSSLYGHQREA
ncbi:hypothetical protein QYE76_023023 [Lolium multiflorum]|uniref:Uncharacterized protein n=1 Tax=Lolium multiflorum TaxID=4521 RepID=A0AAD8RAX0_LOLMU|nr:hypothetical protein QYE76_023023 [Lolium multiflorum]